MEPMDIEVEPLPDNDMPHPSPARQKYKISKHNNRRETRSQEGKF